MQCRFGGVAKLILPLLLLLLPADAQAACSSDGYTVIFINGVFDTKDEAQTETDALKFKLGYSYNFQDINIYSGYNQTHLAGVGDLVESVFPVFNQYDLNTILLQIQPEVTTRKILLVGHSQGTVYANSMYEYLLTHGETKKSVAVYNVATPASFVAGGGGYLTSSGDTAINSIRGKFGFDPLPANIDLVSSVEDALGKFPGHSFSGAYLAEAPDRVVSDIQNQLGALSGEDTEGECFSSPEETLGYRMQKTIFAAADPTAVGVRNASAAAYRGGAVVVGAANSLIRTAYAAAGGAVAAVFPRLSNPAEPENAPKNFDIVKTLYGSSVDQSEAKELLASEQGASVALALPKPETVLPAQSTSTIGLVLGEEVELATTSASTTEQEATTTPSTPIYPSSISLGGVTVHQEEETASSTATSTASTTNATVLFNASTTPPSLSFNECAASLSASFCLLPQNTATAVWSAPEGAVAYHVLVNGLEMQTTTATGTVVTLPDNASTTVTVVAYDASSTAATSSKQSVFSFAQPVVINEIAWAGTQVSPDDQWIELKNRTPYAIDASRLIVYAVDSSQYIPLSGTIPGYDSNLYPHAGFYLIERGVQVLNSISPDLVAQFDPLSGSGEELTLVLSYSGTTTLDKTPPVALCGGWCAGAASAIIGSSTQEGISPNTLSMERLSATTSGALAANWGTNDTYTTYGTDSANGRVLGSPLTENSLHQPEAGWYCDPDTISIQSGSTYHPQSSNCAYLARFIGYPAGSAGGVYKGAVGSSTLVSGASPHFLGRPGQTGRVSDDTITGASAGDQFFVAIWEPRTGFPNPNDSANFNSYFTTGAQLDGSSTTPHQLYRVIPFAYGS